MERILIDTNIIIDREENKVVDRNVSHLYRMLYDSENYKLVIHPISLRDIDNCSDERKKSITKSKFQAYSTIEDPPQPDDSFHDAVGFNKNRSNDLIDNTLLYAVYKNCVSYLITNDKKLQNKAKKLGIGDRVIGLERALQLFVPQEQKSLYTPVSIHEISLYNIDINDPFFDSLRINYHNFNNWFNKKARNGEKAYISKDADGGIGSFLLLKNEGAEENYSDFKRPLIKEPTLKVSTMKVADRGKHIGEILVRIIFERAKADRVNQIYATMFPEQIALQDLLEEYGFAKFTTKETRKGDGTIAEENVFLKQMNGDGYPNINWEKRTFIVPIQPGFHYKLFNDAEQNYQLNIEDLEMENIPANSIKKAYLCNSPSKRVRQGDVVCFYLSKSKRQITAVGIVDAVFSGFGSAEEMLSVAGKRTIYTIEDICSIYNRNNAKVMLFKQCLTLKRPINYSDLKQQGILAGPPISITEIKASKIEELRKMIETQDDEIITADKK